MHARFRFLVLALLVCGLTGQSPNKAEQNRSKQDKKTKPEPKVPGLEWTATQLSSFTYKFHVGVRQEPPRLGPGESGQLFLTLPSKGYWGRPSGKSNDRGIYARFRFEPPFHVDCKSPTQGPITVDPSRTSWDPPKNRRRTYEDMVVLRLPIKIANDASHGLHDVEGTIEVAASMREPVAILGGHQRDTPQNRYLTSLGVQTGRVSFRGKVKVGNPIPAVTPAVLRNDSTETTDASSASPSNPNGEPADTSQDLAESRTPSLELTPPLARPTSSIEDELEVDPDTGFPLEWLALGIVLTLAILLTIKTRRL